MRFKSFGIAKFTAPFRSKLLIKSFSPWITKKDKIIDVGCGNGITSRMVADSLKVDVSGCDIKNYLVEPLAFSLIPKTGKLPFPNKSFDIAMINDVLHHIEKPEQKYVLNEALRVAKKILIFEVEPSLIGKILDIVLNKFHYGSLETPLTFRNSKGWKELLKELGLKPTIKPVKSPIWYPFSHIAIMAKK